ncbi:hypothetical protein GBA52_022772 [Prunus armeniaca]|nr:hypothetical protein GBA52_022772 [Prunus armeniaca]
MERWQNWCAVKSGILTVKSTNLMRLGSMLCVSRTSWTDFAVMCWIPTHQESHGSLFMDFRLSVLKRKRHGFQVLGNKVYLLGGCGWCEDATHREVYCYDASLNAWSEASPLSTARCYLRL